MYVACAYVGSSIGVTVGNSVRVTTSTSASENVKLRLGVTVNASARV